MITQWAVELLALVVILGGLLAISVAVDSRKVGKVEGKNILHRGDRRSLR